MVGQEKSNMGRGDGKRRFFSLTMGYGCLTRQRLLCPQHCSLMWTFPYANPSPLLLSPLLLSPLLPPQTAQVLKYFHVQSLL